MPENYDQSSSYIFKSSNRTHQINYKVDCKHVHDAWSRALDLLTPLGNMKH